MTRARLFVLCVAGALVGGCAEHGGQIPVDFSEAPRDYLARDYERVYERWTRHEQLFQDADVALEVWATFKSWDFREAFVQRWAEVYSLSEVDAKALRDSQREIAHKAYEFHVAAQSSTFKWNDLEKESSAWRARLVDPLGRELTPEYVKVVKLPDAYEAAFFPKRTPFTKSYAIRFAVPADDGVFSSPKSGGVTLRISGPMGHLDLEWKSS